MANQTGKSGRVIAFEPLPQNFEVLKKNVTLNHYSQVTCECLALSNKAGISSLTYRCEAFTGGASLVTRSPFGFCEEIANVEVETTTLDAYVTQHAISKVDFVKIDVEGAEGMVLEGMLQTIKSHRPKILLEEHDWEGSTIDQAHQILSQHGYHVLPVDDTHCLAIIENVGM